MESPKHHFSEVFAFRKLTWIKKIGGFVDVSFSVLVFPEVLSEQLHLFTLMKRRCGVKQGLRKCWFHLQNEIKTRWGDCKNEIGFDVYHIYEHIDVKDWQTRPIMVEKCQNLRNEIKTRWGDSVNLLYWGHRTNKSRRSSIILPIGSMMIHVWYI